MDRAAVGSLRDLLLRLKRASMELSGTSGDGDTDMDDAVYREMEHLKRMQIEQLRCAAADDDP